MHFYERLLVNVRSILGSTDLLFHGCASLLIISYSVNHFKHTYVVVMVIVLSVRNLKNCTK